MFHVTVCHCIFYNYTITFPALAFVSRKVSDFILQGYLWLLPACGGEGGVWASHLFISRNRNPGKIIKQASGSEPKGSQQETASEHQPLLSVNICSQHDVENHSARSVSAAGRSTGTGRPLVWGQIMRPGVHPRRHLHLRRLSMETLLNKHRLVLKTYQSRSLNFTNS